MAHDTARESALETAPEAAPKDGIRARDPRRAHHGREDTCSTPTTIPNHFGALKTARKRRHRRSLVNNPPENNTERHPRVCRDSRECARGDTEDTSPPPRNDKRDIRAAKRQRP